MNLIRRIRPEKTGVRAPLGDLEMAVMRHVWPCGTAGCLAAEVQKALDAERTLALTTILTTLDRLNDKGILKREREGKAYRYRAALTETELQQRIVSGVLGDLIAQFPHAVAAYFAGATPDAGTQESERTDLEALARRLADIRAGEQAGANTEDNSQNSEDRGGE